jgi:hypothetical protein
LADKNGEDDAMTNQPEGQHPVLDIPPEALEAASELLDERTGRHTNQGLLLDALRAAQPHMAADLQKRLGEALRSREVEAACEDALDSLGGWREDQALDGIVETTLSAAWNTATGHSFSLEEK